MRVFWVFHCGAAEVSVLVITLRQFGTWNHDVSRQRSDLIFLPRRFETSGTDHPATRSYIQEERKSHIVFKHQISWGAVVFHVCFLRTSAVFFPSFLFASLFLFFRQRQFTVCSLILSWKQVKVAELYLMAPTHLLNSK
jgi:hypothetical protein